MSKNQELVKSFEYYLNNKDKLMKKYRDEYVVIKDEKVIFHDDTELGALKKALDSGLKMGQFIVQIVAKEDGTTTRAFAQLL